MIPDLNLKFFLSKEKNQIICSSVENNNRLALNWDQISLLDKTNLGLGCLVTKESMTEASEILSGRRLDEWSKILILNIVFPTNRRLSGTKIYSSNWISIIVNRSYLKWNRSFKNRSFKNRPIFYLLNCFRQRSQITFRNAMCELAFDEIFLCKTRSIPFPIFSNLQNLLKNKFWG